MLFMILVSFLLGFVMLGLLFLISPPFLWWYSLNKYILSLFSIEVNTMSFYLSMILATVLVVTFNVTIFSMYYMSAEHKLTYFFSMLYIFVFSMVLLLISNSNLLLFIGWDGLGISSFFLIMHYFNFKSLNNSMITGLSNRFGDAIFLLAFIFLFMAISWAVIFLPIMLLCGISITKSAQFPFSSWLPAAMSAPTPVSALVHSSTLVTAGIVLLLKFFSVSQLASASLFLMTISVVTMFLAGLSAFNELDFKKIIALSTLSQMSILFFSFSTNNQLLTVFHLCSHAFFKSVLFLFAGMTMHYTFSLQDHRFYVLGSLSSKLIFLGVFSSLVSLCGLLFLSGFFSKDFIIDMFLSGGKMFYFSMIFLSAMSLTFFYSGRLFTFMFSVTSSPMKYTVKTTSMPISVMILLLLTILFGYLGSSMLTKSSLFFLSAEKTFLLLIILMFVCVWFYSGLRLQLISIFTKFFLDKLWVLTAQLISKAFKSIDKLFLEKMNNAATKTLFSSASTFIYILTSFILSFIFLGILIVF